MDDARDAKFSTRNAVYIWHLAPSTRVRILRPCSRFHRRQNDDALGPLDGLSPTIRDIAQENGEVGAEALFPDSRQNRGFREFQVMMHAAPPRTPSRNRCWIKSRPQMKDEQPEGGKGTQLILDDCIQYRLRPL